MSSEIAPSTKIETTLDELFKGNDKPKVVNPKLSVRRDVLNKNILRIMSRYFKSIAAHHFQHFKRNLKDASQLQQMLIEFKHKLLPNSNSETLVYALGAFVAAPKLKTLCLDDQSKQIVKLIHKCLSKYTHTDMDVLCSDHDFKTIFSYFTENGMDFMNKEPIVQNVNEHYMRALSDISKQQTEDKPVHSLDLDFID